MGDGYVLGTATEAGLPLKTMGQKRAYNKRLRVMGIPLKLCSKCVKTLVKSEFNKGGKAADGLVSQCRSCCAKYYAENRESRRSYSAKYYAENREALQDYYAKYRSENRERIRARDAKYREESREAIREYHAKNRNMLSISHAEWRAKNRDKNASRIKSRDVLKLCRTCGEEKPETSFSLNRSNADGLQTKCKDCSNSAYRRTCRQAHGEPENTICHLCGLPNDADAWVDHLHPQSLADEFEGDIHEASNLRWAHAECNISRSNRPLTDEQLARIYGEAA